MVSVVNEMATSASVEVIVDVTVTDETVNPSRLVQKGWRLWDMMIS